MFDESSNTVASGLDELKELIQRSTMLSSAEKQYWLDLLSTMSKMQIDQLRNILKTQEEKNASIEEKYDKKMAQAAQKFLSRWDSEKSKTARVKRQEEESQHQVEAQEDAELLLKQL